MGEHECPNCGEAFEQRWLLKAHHEDLECAVVTCRNDAEWAATFDSGVYKPYCDECLSGERAEMAEEQYAI